MSSTGYTGKENRRQILKDAIRRSNEVVIFYGGLKDFARDPASKDTIDRIIREENRQAQFLLEELKKGSGAGTRDRASRSA